MMEDGNYKIYEICSAVGYNSSQYFSRGLFKKNRYVSNGIFQKRGRKTKINVKHLSENV